MNQTPVSMTCACLLLACTPSDRQDDSQNQPAPAISPGGIPTTATDPQTRRELAQKALEGDGAAAWELALYFESFNLAGYQHWAQIAIENGHPYALVTIGYLRAGSDSYCEALRGLHLWSRGLSSMPADDSTPYANADLAAARKHLSKMEKTDCSKAFSTPD